MEMRADIADNAGSRLGEVIDRLTEGGVVLLITNVREFATGYLIASAECATPAVVNFMVRHGKGLVSLALPPSEVDRLGLSLMSRRGREHFVQDVLVSIEARTGVSTGISAADRARTIAVAIDPASGPGEIVSPGHVFPLCVHPGGSPCRPAPAEAAVDLCKIAGLAGPAVLCAVLGPNGDIANLDHLSVFSRNRELPMISIKDIAIRFRAHSELASGDTPEQPRSNHGVAA